MDISKLKRKVTSLLKKYRYACIVLAVGLILMTIPISNNDGDETVVTTGTTIESVSVEERLSAVLSHIDGAGKVHVMLTESEGEEVVYQTNENDNSAENTSSTKVDTVVITDADRNQSGLIRKVNPPSYLGAVIVCQGADNPTVHLAIVDAVSKVTGLGSNRISVLKMK